MRNRIKAPCNRCVITFWSWVAAIALWFRLRLPSCSPGFESQAHHLRFFQFVLGLRREKSENKQKEAGIGPFFLKKEEKKLFGPTQIDCKVTHLKCTSLATMQLTLRGAVNKENDHSLGGLAALLNASQCR